MLLVHVVLVVLVVLAASCDRAPTPAAPSVAEPGVAAPPVADAGTHVDTLRGVAIPDPYRWLEDTTEARTRAFVETRQRYADALLGRLVGRDSLAAHYAAALQGAPTLDRVLLTPAGWLLTRWLGEAPTVLARADGEAKERVVREAQGGSALRALTPSFDGRFVALGHTRDGDEAAAIEVRDTQTGRLLPDGVDDLLTTTSGTRYRVHWLDADDGTTRGFFYPRLWPGSGSGPASERLARSRQFLHRLGTPRSQDLAIFGFGISPDVPMEPDDLAARVVAAPRSRWLVGTVYHVRAAGDAHYAAQRTAGDLSVPRWYPILGLEDDAGYPQLLGDTVFALTRRNADRGRIIRRVLGSGPTPGGTWEMVVPEGRGVIVAFRAQPDGLYFTVREGGGLALHVLRAGARAPVEVALPAAGTITLGDGSPAMPGVLCSVESWATPPRWFRVADGGRVVAAVSLDDGRRGDTASTIVSDRLEARSADGTLVPVSLVYDTASIRRAHGGIRTGTAPALLEAYGGFGSNTDATFDPTIAAWTALGGIYAYAHVRGGGELGNAWHRAAVRDGKRHGVEDVIGAAEALIARGLTSPGRIALQGISFGAGIAGIAPMERPDLFGAVLFEVGTPDELRGAAMDPTAARNLTELGDLESTEGVQLLVRSSPYHRVPARIHLPAMLIHSASGDYNFGTEMLTAKYVARLEAANAGNRPVLWARTTGGHRWLRSLSSAWAGDVASFLLWQTGDPRFQPRAR